MKSRPFRNQLLAAAASFAAALLLAFPEIAAAGAVGRQVPPNTLPPGDDSSAEVNVGFPVKLFGRTYTKLYVNNNGNVTFDGPLGTFTPFGRRPRRR